MQEPRGSRGRDPCEYGRKCRNVNRGKGRTSHQSHQPHQWAHNPSECRHLRMMLVWFVVSIGMEQNRTQHDEPLRLLDSVRVGLGVTKSLPLGIVGLLDLFGGTVSDEDGLSSPLDDDVLALRDVGEINLNLGLSQDICGSRHVDEEVCSAC
jgi:hypothetical protein